MLVSICLSTGVQAHEVKPDDLCLQPKGTSMLAASDFFVNRAYISDGFKDYSRGGFDLKTGQVVAVNKGDFYASYTDTKEPKFFVRNSSEPYPEKEILPETINGGMARVVGFIREDNDVCVRARDGKTYGLLEIKAICQNGVVFDWAYRNDGGKDFIDNALEQQTQKQQQIQR